ncbi:hypothetical protein Vretimale_18334 [Volvox reticuliferus]|uniref:Ubiquilin n=1 Tax=Volvox reticuliferus TaxID=1737510 RepID=A0A8J4LZ90_9CHLO|nr:hypothetical protein Vretimale_18334 [Volvox reticuliferus]
MASTIQIHVKPTAGGDRITLDVAPTASVAEVKEVIAQTNGMASGEQRLIFKGQILKDDERTIDSYGIVNESVLHLVRGRPAGGSSQATAATGPAAASPIGAPGVGGGAAGGFGMPGLPAGLQQAMSAAMNNPAVQSMLSDPELIRTLMLANPAVREVMERNPEVAQILNDPATLREMLRIGSNPALLREHMRTSDRALSNIEALPEGFNALRRLHEQIQEPLMNAAMAPESSSAAAAASAGLAGDPLAALLQQALGGVPAAGGGGTATNVSNSAASADGANTAPNAAPLPNPWAPGGGAGAPGAPGGGGGAAPPGLGLPAGMGPGFAGLGGLGGFGGLNMNPADMMGMLQNPAIQQAMQSVSSNPAMLEAMMNANPNVRAMADANPVLRSMLRSPEAMRAMFDPQNLSQMLQFMQQMEQMRSSNPLLAQLMGGMPGGPLPGGGGAGGGAGFPDMGALLGNGMGGLFGMMPPAPVADPEVAYATQLQQLADMGFFDRQSNIAALQATGGNVNAAVERLLGAP